MRALIKGHDALSRALSIKGSAFSAYQGECFRDPQSCTEIAGINFNDIYNR
jgi:hypothetical protein